MWSRLEGFLRADLTRALERRRAVQGWLMRTTIHIVSASDYWPLAVAVRDARRQMWLRTFRKELGGIDMGRVAARVQALLADGPRKGSEMQRLLEAEGYPRAAWLGAGLWVDLVRVPPSGTWERRRADLYGLAEGWLGPPQVGEVEAQEHLVRRYLGAFGPASLDDLRSWSGLPGTTLRPVVSRLRLRRFRDEGGGELFDLPRAPLPDPDAPAPVRFLPPFDATLLAHARRTGILAEEYRPLVFSTKSPQSVGTFLVDGAVAGRWWLEGGRVRWEPFHPLPRGARREVEEEVERLGAFHLH